MLASKRAKAERRANRVTGALRSNTDELDRSTALTKPDRAPPEAAQEEEVLASAQKKATTAAEEEAPAAGALSTNDFETFQEENDVFSGKLQ